MDGFLLIDKEKNISSFNTDSKIKKLFETKKVGHAGTLDPNATGLLILGVGKATKLLRFIENKNKEYIVEILFGKESDTYDIDGNIIKEIDMNFSLDELKEKIEILKNKDTQIPPMTSAIKVNGKKLLDYQRQGKSIEIKERSAKIYDIEVLSFKKENNYLISEIRLNVSKGFYVRSFVHDLGLLLNGCALAKNLRRTKIGDISIINSKKVEDIKKEDLINIESFLKYPYLDVNEFVCHLAQNGVTFDERQTNIKGPFYVRCNGKVVALYEEVENNKYKPVLIF